MQNILDNILGASSALGPVCYLLVVTALIDVATGLFAAWTSGSLSLPYVADFLKSHVATKWAPILGTLLAGVAIGGTDTVLGSTIIAAGAAQIAAYEVATLGSVGLNLSAAQTKTKGLPGVPPPAA